MDKKEKCALDTEMLEKASRLIFTSEDLDSLDISQLYTHHGSRTSRQADLTSPSHSRFLFTTNLTDIIKMMNSLR